MIPTYLSGDRNESENVGQGSGEFALARAKEVSMARWVEADSASEVVVSMSSASIGKCSEEMAVSANVTSFGIEIFTTKSIKACSDLSVMGKRNGAVEKRVMLKCCVFQSFS